MLWLLSTVTAIMMLLLNVRHSNDYSQVRYVLQASYVAALIWYLIRTAPALNLVPEQRARLHHHTRSHSWIAVLGIGLMLALTVLSESGTVVLMLVMMLAAVWILVAWRREVRLSSVLQGFAVALIAYLAGLRMANAGFISRQMLYLLPAFSLPMYIGGGLLFERTRLGGAQLLVARYGQAMRSLLWGGLLFVPLGLFNALGGSPGSGITWVTKWWMPLWLPWFSGIAEEIWFRLFLVGLCFLLLEPVFPTRPAIAVTAAVLFSGITFGLGHSRTLEGFLVTGLLYGAPMAVTFVRRDWEHAVGAHFMINMIPWFMVFLET